MEAHKYRYKCFRYNAQVAAFNAESRNSLEFKINSKMSIAKRIELSILRIVIQTFTSCNKSS